MSEENVSFAFLHYFPGNVYSRILDFCKMSFVYLNTEYSNIYCFTGRLMDEACVDGHVRLGRNESRNVIKSRGGNMATIRDMMQLDVMKSLKLIAGKGGLDKEVTRVGILDFEFTRPGAAYDTGWKKEFVLTSFLYAVNHPDSILNGIKRLYKYKAVGLAIRNVFHFEINSEIIRFANQHDFPIFIMDDYQVYFEDVITAVYGLEERLKRNEIQEKRLAEIMHGRLDDQTVKKIAQEINCFFANTYYVYCIRAVNQMGENSLKSLMLRGLERELEKKGNALIRYGNETFYFCSQNQSRAKSDMGEYWHVTLGLDPDRFRVGISVLQPFLHTMPVALRQSYYACCYAEIYGFDYCSFDNIGIYQILFDSFHGREQETYLDTVMVPITVYDQKTKSELWKTLLSYEFYNGNIKEIAKDMYTHENTIRYRIKKIYSLFGKVPGDLNFEIELLIAAKMFRIQTLFKRTSKLFD